MESVRASAGRRKILPRSAIGATRWKVTVPTEVNAKKMTPLQYRKVYDTSKVGRGNGGHTFGDKLSEEERMAVIEYSKTL